MPVTHPHPIGIDPQVLLHARSRHRNADAIEIGDGEEQDEQTDDAAAVARCAGQDGRLCHRAREDPGIGIRDSGFGSGIGELGIGDTE